MTSADNQQKSHFLLSAFYLENPAEWKTLSYFSKEHIYFLKRLIHIDNKIQNKSNETH